MSFKKPHQIADTSCIKKEGDKYVIEPRGLNVVWGNDPRYWKITDDGSLELIQVSWLEVSGKVSVAKGKTYKVIFDIEVKRDKGFGWDGTDVLVMAKIGKRGKYSFQPVILSPGPSTIPTEQQPLTIEVSHEQVNSAAELHFGLYEVWSGKWKGGLQIKKAQIIPTN